MYYNWQCVSLQLGEPLAPLSQDNEPLDNTHTHTLRLNYPEALAWRRRGRKERLKSDRWGEGKLNNASAEEHFGARCPLILMQMEDVKTGKAEPKEKHYSRGFPRWPEWLMTNCCLLEFKVWKQTTWWHAGEISHVARLCWDAEQPHLGWKRRSASGLGSPKPPAPPPPSFILPQSPPPTPLLMHKHVQMSNRFGGTDSIRVAYSFIQDRANLPPALCVYLRLVCAVKLIIN